MFYEYALIPDIFNPKNYSNENIFEYCLNPVREVLLDYGITRDLDNGAWSEYIRSNMGQWHPKAKELLKKLRNQNRLRGFNHSSGNQQTCDTDWCAEAEFSHHIERLDGIILSEYNFGPFATSPLYSSIEKLNTSAFWQRRSCSNRHQKIINDYLSASSLLLNCANSLMFIDPHIDPTKDRYSTFTEFFNFIGKRSNYPHIEIHRVGWHAKDKHGSPIWETNVNWEASFKRAWETILKSLTINVTVYIWDDFHDRYLVSDIGGISVSYGFDTSKDANIYTTWTRLSRPDRDDVQREFDEQSHIHELRHKFEIG